MGIFFFFSIKIFFWLLWVFISACRLFLVVPSGGYSLVALHGLLNCGGHSCRAWASVVVAYRLSFPTTCGIFPDQG